MKPKTISEHILQLEGPIRDRALANMAKYRSHDPMNDTGNLIVGSLHEAVLRAFPWKQDDFRFWYSIYYDLLNRGY
jgi:hypothetical protein